MRQPRESRVQTGREPDARAAAHLHLPDRARPPAVGLQGKGLEQGFNQQQRLEQAAPAIRKQRRTIGGNFFHDQEFKMAAVARDPIKKQRPFGMELNLKLNCATLEMLRILE